MKWLICTICGVEFPGRADAKTCSHACRSKLFRIRKREKREGALHTQVRSEVHDMQMNRMSDVRVAQQE